MPADELAEVGREIRAACDRLGLGLRVVVRRGNAPARFLVTVEEEGWGIVVAGSRAGVVEAALRMIERRLRVVLDRAGERGQAVYDEWRRAREGAR